MFRLDNQEEFNTGDSTTNPGSGGSGGDSGGSSGGSGGTSDGQGILVINARDDSPEIEKFLDLLNNPCNYKGRVVYLTAVGPTPRPDPFLWPDKFYFNEGCEWHESPFALGAILNDL